MKFSIDKSDLPPLYNTTPICDIMYPRRPVPGIHISGCNLRCPYCINHEMIRKKGMGENNAQEVIDGLAESGEKMVMISGGEPLFNPKTMNLVAAIKASGMDVAIATNGTHPREMKYLIKNNLLRYVVMDIKTWIEKDRYAEVCGMTAFDRHMDSILESIDFLKTEHWYGCEFRTTMCSLYVTREDVIKIAELIGDKCVYTLQYYTTHQTLRENLANSEYVIPYEDLLSLAKEITPMVRQAIVSEV